VRLELFALFCSCTTPAAPVTVTASVTASAAVTASATVTAPPPAIACLTRTYDAIAKHTDTGWWLVPTNGEPISYADVTQVYDQRYPTGPIRPITEVDFDPGRIRYDALFFATYGKTAREVESALVRVALGHKQVLVHRKIAEPLRRVATRIDAAMKADPSLSRFFESLGGTFNWRPIAGTRELSMHAWGVAIDLDTSRANYWRNEREIAWKNHYPQTIVDAFEAEGFVWGGRWYHYDTMHFEYRPELLDPSCYP
jgi:D-alanyl-D-alanine carboxypeptidase